MRRVTLGRGIGLLALLLLANCSVLVDKQANQCKTDAECPAKGGARSACQSGVCVTSALGPEQCFPDVPRTQDEFLNACSTSKYMRFDNCARLGICNATVSLPPATEPNNPSAPAPITRTEPPAGACRDLAGAGIFAGNVVYMYGANAFEPLFEKLQPTLTASTPPYRAVFLSSAACNGVASQFDSSKRFIKDPPAGPTAQWAHYYDEDGKVVNCTLDPAGTVVDVAVSSVFAQSCDASYETSSVTDYLGPVSPQAIVVPAASEEYVISAEAAHMAFGLGGQEAGGVKAPAPWTNVNFFFIRSPSSVSTILTALFVDVPKNRFWGVDRQSNENLRDAMLVSPSPRQSIGIMQMDYADKNRDNLRTLYVQARGQAVGYLPDSAPNAFDKVNVRDGHYPLWAYLHFYSQVGPGGVLSAPAQAVAIHFAVPKLEVALVDAMIATSYIPPCAMKVSRTRELGDYVRSDSFECGCYFDQKATGKTSCQPCTLPSDCPQDKPACNYGYCERK